MGEVMVEEQKRILELLASGKSNSEIAKSLNYSKRTVCRRINDLFKLYKVNNRLELAIEYQAENLK